MKHFFVALQFLTRLKLVNQTSWMVEDFGRSVPYFPIVGWSIGGFLLGFYLLGQSVFPHQLLMLLLVITEFLYTGGLHADGFMDTCDGLFSGRDRERKLKIMKDSRVGSNGVVGFVFLTLLKWQLLVYIPTIYLPFLLLCMPALSRYTMCLSITKYPYARPEGMGKAFAQYAPPYTITVATIGILIPLLLFYYWNVGTLSIYLAAVAIFVNYLMNSYCTKHLGGVTGDTYGFVVESTEIFLLLATFLFI